MDIVKEIGMPAMMGQLAEECVELAKAALKYQRILMGKNPTPVTESEALDAILEEATDIHDCLGLLAEHRVKVYDGHQSIKKMRRWEHRIEEAKANG